MVGADHRLRRFKRVTFAVKRRRNYPAHFRHAVERGSNVTLIIRQTDFADKRAFCTICFFEHNPVTKTEHLPVAGITQQAAPAGFATRRCAADIFHHRRISPLRGNMFKIINVMGA